MWLAVVVLFVGLGIGREAHAGAKMDWSEYLEPPGARAPRQATPTRTSVKTDKASKTLSKAAAKKAAKAKAKKAKRSARNKRRR